jgi:hypothetical protein
MNFKNVLAIALSSFILHISYAQKIQYVKEFQNKNHPEIGYWFFTPTLSQDERYLDTLKSIIDRCKYTMLFLSSRENANFLNDSLYHPIFKNIVAYAHKRGIKIGLQMWGNSSNVSYENALRMVIENEVTLDENGNAQFLATSKFIRFPDRLLKSDLFRVYAFKKTGEGFYETSTLKDITNQCVATSTNKESVFVTINGGESVKGLTACIMTQQYCSQSSPFGDDEINRFHHYFDMYGDIPFDGFALDEYGNKFVSRVMDMKPNEQFRGRWYSISMDSAFRKKTGNPLDKALFDGRYAPIGKPEVRMKAINTYMDFMRSGVIRVENAVYKMNKAVFGKQSFAGIHNTYHNSLINDEIWADGIGWWDAPREYGHTDENTPTPTQMGIAMAHPMNVMYNQYYYKDLEPVLIKAFEDLKYGIRTHYHALNDKRPLRFDLQMPEAIDGVNKIENCTRLLNTFNPSLPDIKLLVIFGIEAMSNWYPNEAERGVYDINDKLRFEEKAVEIWKAGYLNALVPSDLIVKKKISIGANGKPTINGREFDAVVYLNPQFAKPEELMFLETYLKMGGKLMIEGKATHNFGANDISNRFQSIYNKATVVGYDIDKLSQLGLKKNWIKDGCKNEDGSYVFSNRNSLVTDTIATFSINIDGVNFSGKYKGLVALKTSKDNNIQKIAASGLQELSKNGQIILAFKQPTDVFYSQVGSTNTFTIADPSNTIKPLVFKLK